MDTRLPAGVRRGLPMVALFLAVFSTTWALRQQPGESAAPSQPPAQAELAAQWDQVREMAHALPQPELELEPERPAPSLVELANDPDPGTQAEASTLFDLLAEEASAD